MEFLTLSALATFIAPFFKDAGKTLAVESVKLALENRQDIKNKFLNLFRGEEFISLGLNEEKSPEEVKAVLEARPEIKEKVQEKLESNPELLKELLEIIKQQTGKDASSISINAKNIGQVINNPTGDVNQTNTWS